MRELTSHKVNGLNEALTIGVQDKPGPGNACHDYLIVWPLPHKPDDTLDVGTCHIQFQNGPIGETGINGVSNEALLAIIEDRLLGFQAGEYACRENAIASTKLQEALMWLQKRTRDRVTRGVEGTSQK